MTPVTTERSTDELRRQAVERLEARTAFWSHLTAYVLINAMLIIAWSVVADGGLFWPIFPLFGWGIGLFFHAIETFRPPYSEERIRQEMDRLR